MCEVNKPENDIIESSQLFQARLKANDVLQEHLKLTVTIASATLTLTVTFLKDVIGLKDGSTSLTQFLSLSWILLAVSVLISIFNIAAIVNNLDNPNLTIKSKSFAAGARPDIQWPVLIGFLMFGLGMLSFAIFGAVNVRSFLNSNNPTKPGFEILSEEHIVDKAKEHLRVGNSIIRSMNVVLLKGVEEFPNNFPIWSVEIEFKYGNTFSVKRCYIDALSGLVLTKMENKKT